jgi:hypothetical protein
MAYSFTPVMTCRGDACPEPIGSVSIGIRWNHAQNTHLTIEPGFGGPAESSDGAIHVPVRTTTRLSASRQKTQLPAHSAVLSFRNDLEHCHEAIR